MNLKLVLAMASLHMMASAQTSAGRPKLEFEVASIRVAPPRTGFHFAVETGAADYSSPGMLRCSNCTLATLIREAFGIKNYQLPGKAALGSNTFEVMAKLPDGAGRDEVPAMLQHLLRERFGLAYHFKEQTMRGYQLVIAKSGSKLKESAEGARPAEDPNRQRQTWSHDQQSSGHSHAGLVSFGGSSTYRGDHKTMAELALIISDQIGVPVDNQTGLPGKYDIALSWSGSVAQSGESHGDGGWSGGGAGHGDHGGGGGGSAVASRESGPTLFDAVQAQLGLKLTPTERSVARVFVVDHAAQVPTAN